MESNRNIEEFLGEKIFTWEEWDEVDTGSCQFYGVEFPYESMKKFNGNTVFKTDDGHIDVYNKEETGIAWSGFITDIVEFRETLFKKYNK